MVSYPIVNLVIKMFHTINLKNLILCVLIFSFSLVVIFYTKSAAPFVSANKVNISQKEIQFNAKSEALSKAMQIDIKSENNDYPIDWIDIIAYLACIYDNDFSHFSPADIDAFTAQIEKGKTAAEICDKYKYFTIYKSFYEASLGGLVGDYTDYDANGKPIRKYGLKAFSPIGLPYSYNSYDDFGAKRTYGYSRPHLGCDLIGSMGTPIVAIEEGTVEAIGWNEYGGWRIGIRSLDRKRYYYYAHLQKDNPYAKPFKVGDSINAGTLIGYMGKTGYSKEENVEGIEIPHLHLGVQIAFSQNSNGEDMWIDVFEIVKFLLRNRIDVTDQMKSSTEEANSL